MRSYEAIGRHRLAWRYMKKQTKIRIAWTIALCGLVVGLWLREGPLAYFVAQQRPILMGRYTEEQMTIRLIVTLTVGLILLGVWPARQKTPQEKRRDKFRTILLTGSILGTLIVSDIVLRVVEGNSYIKTPQSHHRLPDLKIQGTFQDVPDMAFTFPDAPPGYPPIEYTLTTDSRGFRNTTDLSACDVVVLGDSFAEGTGVSDEAVWPVLLGRERGWTICNLAMSGTQPPAYLDILRHYGLALKPQIVICLLYEGNDFRDSNYQAGSLEAPRPSLGRIIFYGSPIRARLKKLMIRTLAPIDCRRFDRDPQALADPHHPMYPVSWLPMRVPPNDGHPYAFELKRLLWQCQSPDDLARSRGVQKTLQLLEQMRQLCAQHDIRLIVVYAPDKSHVVLTAAQQSLDAGRLHAFMALKEHNLPPAAELVPQVIHRLGGLESMVAQDCLQKDIAFVSLTEMLQDKMATGRRVYFTYDQHWTPEGHQVVADYLAQTLHEELLTK